MGSQKYPKVVGYELIQQIGGGGFSTVFRAVHLKEHRIAACKLILITSDTSEKERKTVEKEMKVHAALKHRHVLEFLNAVVVELKHAHVYVPGIYMLLEFAAGGDLFDKIAPDVGINEDVAQIYFSQLIEGMDYIHKQGVCHRDLKPENLLLDASGALKISDFGLSSVFRLKESGRTRLLTERCGSLPYVAPELNSDRPYKAEPVDVWGVGVILFTLLAGNTPWDEPTSHSPEYRRYLSGKIFDEAPWNRISSHALSLITGLLAVDPEARLTLADAFAHPWVLRPSQLASQGVAALAESLTAPLRASGDLGYATPEPSGNQDEDGDERMLSAAHQSQFTQSLLLFSQTQSGRRYSPQLTRFYASLGPPLLLTLVHDALLRLGVTLKRPPTGGQEEKLRLRVGGTDTRRVEFRGWVEVEAFVRGGGDGADGVNGSFCVMARDQGNPIEWRRLWRAVIESEEVGPHVLRKRT